MTSETPPSTPTRRSPTLSCYKTPDKTTEHAILRQDGPTCNVQHNVTNELLNMQRLCAAADRVGPPSPFQALDSKLSQSTKCSYKKKAKVICKEANETSNVPCFLKTAFENEEEALKYCWKNPPNPDDIDIKHIGIDSQRNVITTADMQKRPFIFEELDTIEWSWLKAYDSTLLSTKKKKNPYTMCNIAQKGVKLTIHRRGVVRRVYEMPDHRYIKVYHHSCEYLKAAYPSRGLCRNCMNKGWNAKCIGGEDFISIQNK